MNLWTTDSNSIKMTLLKVLVTLIYSLCPLSIWMHTVYITMTGKPRPNQRLNMIYKWKEKKHIFKYFLYLLFPEMVAAAAVLKSNMKVAWNSDVEVYILYYVTESAL